MRCRAQHTVYAGAYMVLLAYLSLVPRFPRPVDAVLSPLAPRFLHFSAYLFLAVLLVRTLHGRVTHAFLLGGVGALLCGIALETAQRVVPQRTFCMTDMLLNSAGSLAGTLLYAIFCHWRAERVGRCERSNTGQSQTD